LPSVLLAEPASLLRLMMIEARGKVDDVVS